MPERYTEPEPRQTERMRLPKDEPYVLSLSINAPFVDNLNGRVLGVLEFPSTPENKSKRVAIVDYGEDFQHKPLLAEAPGLGVVEGRIGLRGINYVPDSHLVVYADMPKGEMLTLGRRHDVHNASYMLGLTDEEPGNTVISREHLDIRYDGQEVIITDRSHNGTVLETKT